METGNQTIASRLKMEPNQLDHALFEKIYLQSRDLWRDCKWIKQFISSPRLSQILFELTGIKPFRLGFDLILQEINPKFLSQSSYYEKLLQSQISFQNISSLKGLIAAFIICLQDQETKEEQLIDSKTLFPIKAGDVAVVNSETIIDFSTLFGHCSKRFYVVSYANFSSYYLYEPNDPHLHHLKKFGYSFNEKLNDRLHPIIYR